MQAESTIGAPATSESGTSQSAESTPSSIQDTTPAPQGQPAGNATAGVQGTQQSDSDDTLAGVPSLEELNKLPDEAAYKKSLIQMRTAIEETFKPKIQTLEQNYSKFEPFADRFETSEQLQELVNLQQSLFGYERDEQNRLIPATQQAVELLNTKYPTHLNFLWADASEQEMINPETGQPIRRIDYWLQSAASDPTERAKALRILGGVEPTAIAPTWQPSDDELDAIIEDPERPTTQDKALQDIYRTLPYDERQELKLNNPDFIRNYLKKEQVQRNLVEQTRVAQERETQLQQQREAYAQQQREAAGNTRVEQGFRTGMTEFANSVVERSKFIQPLDPQSPEAQQLGPQGVAEWNQKAESVNKGMGLLVAIASAALAVPDVQWMAQEYLKQLGVGEQVFSAYDSARLEYANNARGVAELSYGREPNYSDASLGTLQSNERRAMGLMKGQANAVASPLLELLSTFFEMKAGSYNQTLNSAPTARPSVNGNGYDPTRAPAPRPAGWLSRSEMNSQFGG